MGFNPKKFIKQKEEEIKRIVKDGTALSATSGGVDSITCTILAGRVLKERLCAVFIEDGLMRSKDSQEAKEELAKFGIPLEIIKKEKEFFENLKDKEDPEEKRKIFRATFYTELGKIVKEKKAKFLIQGTIATDIVETKKGIKTQHNVLEQIGISPEKYGFSVIEPLKELYKPQVREVAKALGISKKIYERMPFPGPGFATRVIGEITPERIEIVRKATQIIEEELSYLKPFQTFGVLFKDKATGIKNGKRILGDIIAIRCVNSKDALQATVPHIPMRKLTRIQERIIKEIPSVTKVLYDITPKPPSTIEYI